MKKRIVGYDIAKTLAMFLVVMLHYSLYTRYYSSGIAGTLVTVMCVVCVPLFFAVNGALLLPRPLDEHRHYRKVLQYRHYREHLEGACSDFFHLR
ncbi:MAG: acyltransferase family protein [Bifidobacterium dentium]